MTKPPRDFQKLKLYNWEDTLEKGELISLHDCIRAVHLICPLYINTVPEVVHIHRTKMARGCLDYINLPPNTRYPLIVIHEIAHVIVEYMFGIDVKPHHGAEFVHIYISLLSKHISCCCGNKVFSYDILLEDARKSGLMVDTSVTLKQL